MLKLLIVLLYITTSYCSADDTVILECHVHCHCNKTNVPLNHGKEKVEANVICKFKTREKSVTVSEGLLQMFNDSKRSMTMYVSIDNAEVVYITEGFINKHKEFVNNALDAYDVGELIYPKQLLQPLLEPNPKNNQMSIGMLKTRVRRFPHKLFAAFPYVSLIMNLSTIDNLDFGVIVPSNNTKVFVKVSHSKVGTIFNSNNSVALISKKSKILFLDSEIDVIKTGALNLEQESYIDNYVEFKNSIIRLIERESIYITKLLSLYFEGCTFDSVSLNAFVIQSNTYYIEVVNNNITVYKDSLSDFNCSYSDVHIEDNLIIPIVTGEQFCIEYDQQVDMSKSCKHQSNIVSLHDFLDPSCQNNSFLLPSINNSQSIIIKEVIAPNLTATPLCTTHNVLPTTTETTLTTSQVTLSTNITQASLCREMGFRNMTGMVEFPTEYVYCASGLFLILILIIAALIFKIMKKKSTGNMNVDYWPASTNQNTYI